MKKIYTEKLCDDQKKNLRFRFDFELSEAACHYLEWQYIYTIDDYCRQVNHPICGGMMESFHFHTSENEEIHQAIENSGLSEFVEELKRHYREDELTREEILQMPIGYLELGCNVQLSLLMDHIRTVGDFLRNIDDIWVYLRISKRQIENIKSELERVLKDK